MRIRGRFPKNQRGFTLVEVLIALAILSIVALASMKAFWFISSQNVEVNERSFAAQKAIQMMEELRGLISDTNSNIGVLDDYDDGSAYKTILTTRVDVTDPADPISGNDGLKYVRRVSVIQMPNETLARRVYVRVYKADTKEALAETVSVLRTILNQNLPTQVYDVYVLVLENVPGWWVSLSTMKPMFDNIAQDLETRNPGLELRLHYITRLAYGRDPYYTPYINESAANRADLADPQGVYFYPGNVNKPSVGDFLYYVPDSLAGRINVDGTVTNGASYSIADQYNHGARYPEEEAIYGAVVASATAAGVDPPEISYRMLLEKMNSSPADFLNSLVINLHGELVPLPPLRNYSDAAKSTDTALNSANAPWARVVTHPEQLSYNANTAVNLRVYPYFAWTPDSYATSAAISTVTVLLTSTQIPAGNITVRKCAGSDTSAYAWQLASDTTDYNVSYPADGQTLITLWNSPLRHPPNGNFGLPTTDRLYGLEYIPSLLAATTYFVEGDRDLTTNSGSVPKNTARWVIRISPSSLVPGRHTVETRIGLSTMTGTADNEPTNVSRTYVWVGQTPPVTEQYQFIGDARHMPYADVKTNLGFNWYFENFDTTDYPGFTNRADRWNSACNIDIPRYFQILRGALMNSVSLWTSMTGYSFYYVGIGGEIGYDASNGFGSGIPVRRVLWVPAGGASEGVDEITDAQTHPYMRVISRADDTWWGMHWLGELYPDYATATWIANGNLPVGTGNYYRRRYNTLGYSLGDPQKRTNTRGAASFFNGNPTAGNSNWFDHQFRDGNGATLTSSGSLVGQDFNFSLLPTMTASRPFLLNDTDTGSQPPEWSAATYQAARNTLSTVEAYYETNGYTSTEDSSALIRISNSGNVCGMIMNGLSPQTTFGSAQISKLCMVNLLRGFMIMGSPYITTGNIPQLPLVTISSPTVTDEFINPSSIYCSWSEAWTRWDGVLYSTQTYPTGYVGTSTVTYNLKYSSDNGASWKFVQTGGAADDGVYSSARALASPYTWNVTTLPEGSYLLRVEGYRQDRRQHYTYHQRRVYIKR